MENGKREIVGGECNSDEQDLWVVEEPTLEWEAERRIRTFEDLRVWQYCRDLRNDLAALARTLPHEERYRLQDQIIRASRSVTNNLAEGYGRFTYKDNIHFCRQSRGSLYELIDHLSICADEQYIADGLKEALRGRCLSAIRQLNGYIRFLNDSAGGARSQ